MRRLARPEASLERPVRWSDLNANGRANDFAYVGWVVERGSGRELALARTAWARDDAAAPLGR